jgi:hypothetical protein
VFTILMWFKIDQLRLNPFRIFHCKFMVECDQITTGKLGKAKKFGRKRLRRIRRHNTWK